MLRLNADDDLGGKAKPGWGRGSEGGLDFRTDFFTISFFANIP